MTFATTGEKTVAAVLTCKGDTVSGDPSSHGAQLVLGQPLPVVAQGLRPDLVLCLGRRQGAPRKPRLPAQSEKPTCR